MDAPGDRRQALRTVIARVRHRQVRQQRLRGADAVSYTHLRAHETVLDLVCRLLLEKKNNTIAMTIA